MQKLKSQIRMMFTSDSPEEGEIALSIQPRKGAISARVDRNPFQRLSLIDQVMEMMGSSGRPFKKIAICDVDPQTTLAAAIAAGADVSTDVCDDVAQFSVDLGRDDFDGMPGSSIVKACLYHHLGVTIHHDNGDMIAQEAVGFWFDEIHDLDQVELLAGDYDKSRSLPCGMIYAERVGNVVIAWSERYPLPYVDAETFIWLKPWVGGFKQLFAGTLADNTEFMEEAFFEIFGLEERLLAAHGKENWGDYWYLSDDCQVLASPSKYIPMTPYTKVFNMLINTAP